MRLELVTYVSFAFLNSYQGLEFVKQLNRILNNSVFCCTHVSSFKTFAGNIIYIAFNPVQVLFSFLQLFLSFLQRNSYDRYTDINSQQLSMQANQLLQKITAKPDDKSH